MGELITPELNSDALQPAHRRPDLRRVGGIGLLLLVLVPPALILLWLDRWAVNMPYWDQWIFAKIYDHVANGTLTWHELFRQHNEHRILVPRLLFIALAFLTGWNIRAEQFFNVAVVGVGLLSVWFIGRRTFPHQPLWRSLLLLFASLALFSPVQNGNWTWGFQLTFFLPGVCLLVALAVGVSNLPTWLRLLLASVACWMATFSLASGLMTWLCAWPALLVGGPRSNTDSGVSFRARLSAKRLLIILVPWTLISALVITHYLWGYEKPSYHPSLLVALKQPIDALEYFVALCGSPLRGAQESQGLIASQLWGVTVCLTLLASGLAVLWRRNTELLFRAAPWLGLVAWATGSIAVTTAGRVGFGVQQALSGRYTTFAILVIVPTAYLAVLALVGRTKSRGALDDHVDPDSSANKLSTIAIFRAVVAAGVLIAPTVALGLGVRPSLTDTRAVYQARVTTRAAMQFGLIVPDTPALSRVVGDPVFLMKRATLMEQLGLLHPGLVKSSDVRLIESPDVARGVFDGLVSAPGEKLNVIGWAHLNRQVEPAHAVVLCYEKEDGVPVAFAVMTEPGVRPDVALAFNDERLKNAGWSGSFDRAKLPDGALRVSAWALDTEFMKVTKLEKSHVIPLPIMTVVP